MSNFINKTKDDFDDFDDFDGAPVHAPAQASLGAGHPCYPGFAGSPLGARGRSGQQMLGLAHCGAGATMFESWQSQMFGFYVLLCVVHLFSSTPPTRP